MKSGSEQLTDWIVRRQATQEEAAELLEIHYTLLSKYINGRRRPGLDSAIQIERKTGIPVEAWASENVD